MGIGSSSRVSGAEFCTNLRTVFSVTGSKNVSGFPVKRLPKDGSEDCWPNSFSCAVLFIGRVIETGEF